MPQKDPVAAANQRCRDMANRLHQSEEKLQPLREELRAAQVERDKAVAEAVRLKRKVDSLMELVGSIVGVAHELARED